MPLPHDSLLPHGVDLVRFTDGGLIVSEQLTDLLISSRSNYDWPAGTGATKSQQAIIDLETRVNHWLVDLNPENAHALIRNVSLWGGNSRQAQNHLDNADPDLKPQMVAAIQKLIDHITLAVGLNQLCGLPVLGLIKATKIYRFCCSGVGAAVDRKTDNKTAGYLQRR